MRLYVSSSLLLLLFFATSHILAAPVEIAAEEKAASTVWGRIKSILPTKPKSNWDVLIEYHNSETGSVSPETRHAVENIAKTTKDATERTYAETAMNFKNREALQAVKDGLTGQPMTPESQKTYAAVGADKTHPLNPAIKIFQDIQQKGQKAAFTSRQGLRAMASNKDHPLNTLAKQTKADYLDDLTRTKKGAAAAVA